MATGNPYRREAEVFFCPVCEEPTAPHCALALEGCRWNVCVKGHTTDIKTMHVLGVSTPEGTA